MRQLNMMVAGLLVMAVPVLAIANEPGTGKTCGQIIAEKAVMPEKTAAFMTAAADMIDAHAAWMKAHKGDKNAAKEAQSLAKLSRSHRALAKSASAIATSMKGMATLPGAPHDMKLIDPKLAETMQNHARAARELAELLQKEAAEMEKSAKMFTAAK
jgi:hypothetical protein